MSDEMMKILQQLEKLLTISHSCHIVGNYHMIIICDDFTEECLLGYLHMKLMCA